MRKRWLDVPLWRWNKYISNWTTVWISHLILNLFYIGLLTTLSACGKERACRWKSILWHNFVCRSPFNVCVSPQKSSKIKAFGPGLKGIEIRQAYILPTSYTLSRFGDLETACKGHWVARLNMRITKYNFTYELEITQCYTYLLSNLYRCVFWRNYSTVTLWNCWMVWIVNTI
jgi:hypothetical protein